MFACPVHLAARQLILAWLTALGASAWAQQTIQFSKPATEDPSSKANAFLPDSGRHNPASFNAPASLFGSPNTEPSFDLPGGAPRVIPENNGPQWQKYLEERRSWTFMTPEEILGIPTPEKMLGLPDPNDDSRLTPEQRFLRRQDREMSLSTSNAQRQAEATLWQSGNDDDNKSPFQPVDAKARLAGALTGSDPSGTRTAGLLFGQRPGGVAGMVESSDSAWSSAFQSPNPLPKPTPEQLAGMDRFRALMEAPSEKPAAAPGFQMPPASPVDPNMQSMPAFNPAGQSFKALESDIAKPKGLTPLPGVTGPPPAPKKAVPLVQPPPWLQSPLQNSTPAQRQF